MIPPFSLGRPQAGCSEPRDFFQQFQEFVSPSLFPSAHLHREICSWLTWGPGERDVIPGG